MHLKKKKRFSCLGGTEGSINKEEMSPDTKLLYSVLVFPTLRSVNIRTSLGVKFRS